MCVGFMLQIVIINMSREVHLITFLPSSSVSPCFVILNANSST